MYRHVAIPVVLPRQPHGQGSTRTTTRAAPQTQKRRRTAGREQPGRSTRSPGRLSRIPLPERAGSYTFPPDLTFQFYAQPFFSALGFADFKEVADPHASAFEDRFRLTSTDLDPDRNAKQFRSNAVLRWEYRPGSTLFVVWNSGLSDTGRHGSLDLTRDVGQLFDADGTNVLFVKSATGWDSERTGRSGDGHLGGSYPENSSSAVARSPAAPAAPPTVRPRARSARARATNPSGAKVSGRSRRSTPSSRSRSAMPSASSP